MVKIMVFSLAAMLGFFSRPLLAEGGAYQIELMVFSQSTDSSEVFDQVTSQLKWPSGLTELTTYKRPDNTSLDDSYTALSKDSAYTPILHVAWIGDGSPVHIQGLGGKLDGYIQMQRDQGLQMTVDLELSAYSDIDGKKSLIYRLNEKRFIKPGEVYYLDHPKFGVIVKISPVQAQEN